VAATAWPPDALDAQDFAGLVAPLFEAAPRFIERLAASRPYGSWEALFASAVGVALDMPSEEQVELIDAHPRIGAPPGSVSALSFAEQGYSRESAEAAAGSAGAAAGSAGAAVESAGAAVESAGAGAEAERVRVQAELDRLNAAYEAVFGFRYVVFVAGRPRAQIVPLLEAALLVDPASERERALRDVVAIARHRAIGTGLMTDDSGQRDRD